MQSEEKQAKPGHWGTYIFSAWAQVEMAAKDDAWKGREDDELEDSGIPQDQGGESFKRTWTLAALHFEKGTEGTGVKGEDPARS